MPSGTSCNAVSMALLEIRSNAPTPSMDSSVCRPGVCVRARLHHVSDALAPCSCGQRELERHRRGLEPFHKLLRNGLRDQSTDHVTHDDPTNSSIGLLEGGHLAHPESGQDFLRIWLAQKTGLLRAKGADVLIACQTGLPLLPGGLSSNSARTPPCPTRRGRLDDFAECARGLGLLAPEVSEIRW